MPAKKPNKQHSYRYAMNPAETAAKKGPPAYQKNKFRTVDVGAAIAKMYTRDPMSYLPPKRSSGPNYKRKG